MLSQLSLYTPPPQKIQRVQPERGQVEESVAALRKLAEPYTTWCQGVYGTVKPKVDSTVQFGQSSRLKKVIYPTGLMAVAASMYYPQEVLTVAKNTGDTVYDLALQAYVAVEKLIKGKPASKKDRAEKSSSGETKA
ncbi:hypothetical protein cypCar_00037782 [Cyprinus carpio]|nr:hypothetical protein cypCar_00037782 [Cyprinus carpio]